jgi:peroxiredoxin
MFIMNRCVLISMIVAVVLLPLMARAESAGEVSAGVGAIALVPLTGRAELAESPEKVHPLDKGAAVPDVTLQTVDGKKFALKAETLAQPTVIIFYRGGWCPFCNAHLADVQKAEKDLLALGYRIVAISPDPVAALRATADHDHLEYTLLSDADMQATGAFGLAYGLDDATLEKYRNYKVPLTAQYEGHFWLPVPAVYIVGKDGRIAFAHWDPNYKVRLSATELLKAAREANAK